MSDGRRCRRHPSASVPTRALLRVRASAPDHDGPTNGQRESRVGPPETAELVQPRLPRQSIPGPPKADLGQRTRSAATCRRSCHRSSAPASCTPSTCPASLTSISRGIGLRELDCPTYFHRGGPHGEGSLAHAMEPHPEIRGTPRPELAASQPHDHGGQTHHSICSVIRHLDHARNVPLQPGLAHPHRRRRRR